MNRIIKLLGIVALTALVSFFAAAQETSHGVSDAALVRSLEGFKNGKADVNGITLHYVEGGEGNPLVLLPGWPQTWWEYHKVMPELAKHFHVIVVDIRGMGTSSKPQNGHDKKTMAKDIYALVRHLGYDDVDILLIYCRLSHAATSNAL